MALLSVTEALRIAKADSKSSVLILLDLSAAFDIVNHQILLSTLSSLDITGIPLRWFESYLTGRSFKVTWGGEVSKATSLLFILLFIKCQYTVFCTSYWFAFFILLHILLLFLFFYHIYALVLLLYNFYFFYFALSTERT